MLRRIGSVVSLLLAICGLFGMVRGEEYDWLIVPGKRVGPIVAGTTRADLTRLFGAKNIDDGEILRSDLGTETGSIVYPNAPDLSLAVFWINDAPDSRIRRVRICPDVNLPGKCRWHTAEGITLGSALRDLERLNGRAFQLNGFDWGMGGLITAWQGGRLEKLSAACGGLTVRVDPAPGPASDERARLLDVVEGDDEFSSAHAAMQGLNPVIDFISFSFQNCK